MNVMILGGSAAGRSGARSDHVAGADACCDAGHARPSRAEIMDRLDRIEKCLEALEAALLPEKSARRRGAAKAPPGIASAGAKAPRRGAVDAAPKETASTRKTRARQSGVD